jgi:hypothetical protein
MQQIIWVPETAEVLPDAIEALTYSRRNRRLPER